MINFRLRPWRPNDKKSLVKYANNALIAANMTDGFPHPYGEEAGKNFIKMAMSGSPINILAIEIDGEACGGIGLHPQSGIHRKNAEMGYWLAEPFWGNGIVSAAIPQMVEYGFQKFEIDRIFARPFGPNIASQRALEKAGFTLEARFSNTIFKNGVFQDELIYAVRRND